MYAIAAQGYENYAPEGKTTAMTALGELYVDGHGVKKDFQKAMLWFKNAAKQGNAEAVQLLKSMTNDTNKSNE